MYDTYREVIEALRATPDTLNALLRSITQEQAMQARGGDEEWSVVEVVCHLRDSEECFLERMVALRDEPDPHITGFDQMAWAAERRYAESDLREAQAAFARWRELHVDALAALRPEQWQRAGQHIQYGTVTILNHTLHTLWHDSIHLAQIGRQLHKV